MATNQEPKGKVTEMNQPKQIDRVPHYHTSEAIRLKPFAATLEYWCETMENDTSGKHHIVLITQQELVIPVCYGFSDAIFAADSPLDYLANELNRIFATACQKNQPVFIFSLELVRSLAKSIFYGPNIYKFPSYIKIYEL